jgi:hypothetical protein
VSPSESSASKVPEYLLAVWEVAKQKPPHPVAARYYLPGVRFLVALCAELQLAAGSGTFFLACRHAGALIGENFRRVSGWLKKLEADGVLRRITTGSKAGRRANEYVFQG